jgi:short-subunit dehydrogenase
MLRKEVEEIAQSTKKPWAVIYGATTEVGKLAAKVMFKHGYHVLLIDSNLSKLQAL